MSDDKKDKPAQTSSAGDPPKRKPPMFVLGTFEKGMTFGSGLHLGDIGTNPLLPDEADIIRAALNKKLTGR